MLFKVINGFRDAQDEKRLYKVGEEYPREGYEPSQERLEQLSSLHPRYGCAFIEQANPEKIIEDPKLSLSISELRKMNKAPQEELIVELGGDPTQTSNEDERINLIVELQEQKQAENNQE